MKRANKSEINVYYNKNQGVEFLKKLGHENLNKRKSNDHLCTLII